MTFDDCVALAGDSFFGGTTEATRMTGSPGLTMIQSDVTLVTTGIVGPRIFPPAPTPGVPAIAMTGGRLRATGYVGAGGGGIRGESVNPPFPAPPFQSPAIVSDGGVVEFDPDLSVSGAQVGSSTFLSHDTPFMVVIKTFPASVSPVPLDVYANPGASVFVAMSLPHLPMPSVLGDLWLDPSPGGILLAASGTTDASGFFRALSPWNVGWPFGATPAVQAVVVDQGLNSLSLPAVGVMGLDF